MRIFCSQLGTVKIAFKSIWNFYITIIRNWRSYRCDYSSQYSLSGGVKDNGKDEFTCIGNSIKISSLIWVFWFDL